MRSSVLRNYFPLLNVGVQYLCTAFNVRLQVLTKHVISQLTQHAVSLAVCFQERVGSVTFTAGVLLIYKPWRSACGHMKQH